MRTRDKRLNYYYNDSQLGKTWFGKLFSAIGDISKGFLNVGLTPIEGIIGTQIYDPTFSDSKFGDFVEGSMKANSKLNALIGNVVVGAFGADKLLTIKDIDAITDQQERKTQLLLLQNLQRKQQYDNYITEIAKQNNITEQEAKNWLEILGLSRVRFVRKQY